MRNAGFPGDVARSARSLALVLVLALALVPALVVAAPAPGANPMVGSWRASSGYTVQIPAATGSFQLVFVSASGERIVHPAQWTAVGKEFTWTDKQGSSHTATLQSGKPERIEDVNSAYPGSPAYWYRLP